MAPNKSLQPTANTRPRLNSSVGLKMRETMLNFQLKTSRADFERKFQENVEPLLSLGMPYSRKKFFGHINQDSVVLMAKGGLLGNKGGSSILVGKIERDQDSDLLVGKFKNRPFTVLVIGLMGALYFCALAVVLERLSRGMTSFRMGALFITTIFFSAQLWLWRSGKRAGQKNMAEFLKKISGHA